MPWVCKVCNEDHGGEEFDPPPRCYTTTKCKNAGTYACKWKAPKPRTWKAESGNLTNGSSKRDDLVTLKGQVSGNIYSSSTGTVVGGNAIKGNAKKVDGLDDPSARIDIQRPPGNGVYNLGYQTGSNSHACVLFTDLDAEDVVLDKLLDSLDQCRKLTSPSAQDKLT